ncbi:hypothetical protein [Tautonia rosea]|nr:hypothetical protein [Tautonia rosea]
MPPPPAVIDPTDGIITITLSNVTVDPPEATINVDYYDDDEP